MNSGNILQGDRLVLGTCYYPEHWDKSLWEEDLNRMLANGIEVIRIAEFAWSKVELHEGEFDFTFFDEFLDLAEKADMKVIFCTPTATPPAWLTNKYPEVLNARIDGTLIRHGMRRHYNYNSPKYWEKSAIIVEKFAEHYAKRPCIIGWQLDNEFNCEEWEYYSESDTLAFREFVKKKYGTLEKVNEAWGTVFWNQTYTAWDEIFVPRTTPGGNNQNPSYFLDYKRFISDSVCRYAKMQSDIVRKYIKPGDFITTNSLFGNMDHCRLTKESLDFMMYDSYPNFGYCLDNYKNDIPSLNDRRWSVNLAETRAISGKFGIMEQQAGSPGNHRGMEGPAPRPGQITLWTMQSIAHGADYVSYFRWRTCTMGSEIYWHGILDYSGRDNRRLREVGEVHKKLQRLDAVAGSRFKAEVGLVKEYDNGWDSELDAWHGRIERASHAAWFNALQKSHTPYDYCYLDHMTVEELSRYKVLIYSHAVILTEESAAKLTVYVEQGGTVLFGCRAGYKDATGKCVMLKLPGLIQDLCGTDIPEYSYVAPDDPVPFIEWNGEKLPVSVFNDQLVPVAGGKVEAEYQDAYYAGTPALISKETGRGKTYYFGGTFTEEAAAVFLRQLGVAEPYSGKITVPECCEIAVREKDGEQYLFVLNYSKNQVGIDLKQKMENLYTGETEQGAVALEAYGTRVYRL